MSASKRSRSANSLLRAPGANPRKRNLSAGSAASAEVPLGAQTLMRGLAVVDAVARGARDVKEICQLVGTTRSTTHRLVVCLIQAGYLRRSAQLGYLLGPKLIEFGFQARDETSLSMVARSFLVELAQATGDTIHLGVRDGDHVLYLDKVSGTKGLEMRSRIGSRMRIATTAMGKALMLDATEQEWKRCYELGTGAALKLPPIPATRLSWEEFRDAMRRYATGQCAFDLEENEMSIRCVAAPIREADHGIIAAVSVSSTVPYMPMKRMREVATLVQHTASAISSQLGWQAAQAKRDEDRPRGTITNGAGARRTRGTRP